MSDGEGLVRFLPAYFVPNPYAPVAKSTASNQSVDFSPLKGLIVDLKYGTGGVSDSRYVIENSRNPAAWLDATSEDSFVSLGEME